MNRDDNNGDAYGITEEEQRAWAQACREVEEQWDREEEDLLAALIGCRCRVLSLDEATVPDWLHDALRTVDISDEDDEEYYFSPALVKCQIQRAVPPTPDPARTDFRRVGFDEEGRIVGAVLHDVLDERARCEPRHVVVLEQSLWTDILWMVRRLLEQQKGGRS